MVAPLRTLLGSRRWCCALPRKHRVECYRASRGRHTPYTKMQRHRRTVGPVGQGGNERRPQTGSGRVCAMPRAAANANPVCQTSAKCQEMPSAVCASCRQCCKRRVVAPQPCCTRVKLIDRNRRLTLRGGEDASIFLFRLLSTLIFSFFFCRSSSLHAHGDVDGMLPHQTEYRSVIRSV